MTKMSFEERSQLCQKMETLSNIDGTECGGVLDNIRAAVWHSDYLQLDEEDTETFLNLAKKMVETMEQWYAQEAVSGNDEDFLQMNKYYEEDGIPVVPDPEGYKTPTEEELEEQGVCADHSYSSRQNWKPSNSCERCWRIYFANNPEAVSSKS